MGFSGITSSSNGWFPMRKRFSNEGKMHGNSSLGKINMNKIKQDKEVRRDQSRRECCSATVEVQSRDVTF